jgi:hypothetical protein
MVISAMLVGNANEYYADVEIEETSMFDGNGQRLHIHVDSYEDRVVIFVDDEEGKVVAHIIDEAGNRHKINLVDVLF